MSVAETHLAQAERKLYINAPPGSGKTVTGLYLWAQLFKCPAVVLSPNSAIQSQWLARMDLFEQDGQPIADELLSSNPKQPGLFTSLTYQSVTMPARGGNDLSDEALQFWKQSLLEKEKVEVVAGINLPMLIKLASIRNSAALNEAVLEARDAARKYISVASEVLAGSQE